MRHIQEIRDKRLGINRKKKELRRDEIAIVISYRHSIRRRDLHHQWFRFQRLVVIVVLLELRHFDHMLKLVMLHLHDDDYDDVDYVVLLPLFHFD